MAKTERSPLTIEAQEFARAVREGRAFLTPTDDEPSMDELEEMAFDGECSATDGCWVEPDGRCEHGHVSWLRYLGLI